MLRAIIAPASRQRECSYGFSQVSTASTASSTPAPRRTRPTRPKRRDKLGAEFVDYYTHIKKAEIDRFLSEVTDWEHRAYFEMF